MTVSLMTKEIQLLKNYNKIWKKIETLMKIDLDLENRHQNYLW